MSLIGALLATSVVMGGLYLVRFNAEKGQMQWVANKLAEATGKPTINIGAKRSSWGEVRCDIHPGGRSVYCDAENMSEFPDRTFSVALMSHLLEHVAEPELALQEAQRIADNVVVLLPSPADLPTWLTPSHKWVFLGQNKIAIDPAIIASGLATVGLGILIAASSRARP